MPNFFYVSTCLCAANCLPTVLCRFNLFFLYSLVTWLQANEHVKLAYHIHRRWSTVIKFTMETALKIIQQPRKWGQVCRYILEVDSIFCFYKLILLHIFVVFHVIKENWIYIMYLSKFFVYAQDKNVMKWKEAYP